MGMAEDIILLEQHVRELIIKYEQYFLGLEKREPLKLLDQVDRCVRQYRNIPITNTMLNFRYTALLATLSTHRQKWVRINRLIEEGKYSRERFKMEMHAGLRSEPSAPPKSEFTPEVEQLYQQYLKARKECNLPTENVSPAMIATAIEKQKPAILSKHHCSAVEFRVVVEDGKPKIKARPKL